MRACVHVRASCCECCESVRPNVDRPTYKSPVRIGPCYREASQGLVNDGVGGCGGDSTSTVAKANRGGVIPCDDGGGVDVKMPVG